MPRATVLVFPDRRRTRAIAAATLWHREMGGPMAQRLTGCLHVRTEPELRARLDRLAQQRGQELSSLVRDLVCQSLDEESAAGHRA